MNRPYTAAAVVLMLATPAMSQELKAARPSITVLGQGLVETAPDTFRMSADLQGRGADQVAALRVLADAQMRVSDIQLLDGLEKARLTTGAPSVSPTFDPQCGGDGYGRDTEDCPVVGYVAAISFTLEAGPASRAGDAMSLAAERGASNAKVESFYLSDDAAQAVEAQRAAFNDARRQAESLAAAAGQRIKRVLTLQDPNASNARRVTYGYMEDVVVTANRTRQTVSLDVAPPPVRTEARVLATFEIE